MPFKVRIKVGAVILLAIWIALWTLAMNPILGLLVIGLFVLYAEMRYEKWNFFGEALLDVRNLGGKNVALTFDDGPSACTSQILDILKSENIKATFFFLGKNIERHPEIARRAVAEGHAVGIHGYEHFKYHFMGLEQIRADLDRAVAAFRANRVEFKPLVRFPHGAKNLFAVKEIERREWTLCGWGLGVWDSKRPGASIIASRARALQSGDILLLHDGDGTKENPDRAQTVEALSSIIQDLKSRGFSFVTLDQALSSKTPRSFDLEGVRASPPDAEPPSRPSAFS